MVIRARTQITRRTIDRDYPYQVEIAVPVGGLGDRLNAMHHWCAEHAADYQTQAGDNTVRFCFASDRHAREFAELIITPSDWTS